MVENFGGSTLYLILYIIQLLGLSFYSYLVLFNPKKIINDYQVGDGAIAPIRLIGSFIVPIVLRKLNQDPAIAGSVVVTTVTDVIGFLSFLGLATIFLI